MKICVRASFALKADDLALRTDLHSFIGMEFNL